MNTNNSIKCVNNFSPFLPNWGGGGAIKHWGLVHKEIIKDEQNLMLSYDKMKH